MHSTCKKENWHHGIIGIVSSKVTEMYYKPSILICLEGDMGKGSGRSVPGFDLYSALSKCNNYIEKIWWTFYGNWNIYKKRKF